MASKTDYREMPGGTLGDCKICASYYTGGPRFYLFNWFDKLEPNKGICPNHADMFMRINPELFKKFMGV